MIIIHTSLLLHTHFEEWPYHCCPLLPSQEWLPSPLLHTVCNQVYSEASIQQNRHKCYHLMTKLFLECLWIWMTTLNNF